MYSFSCIKVMPFFLVINVMVANNFPLLIVLFEIISFFVGLINRVCICWVQFNLNEKATAAFSL